MAFLFFIDKANFETIKHKSRTGKEVRVNDQENLKIIQRKEVQGANLFLWQ